MMLIALLWRGCRGRLRSEFFLLSMIDIEEGGTDGVLFLAGLPTN